MPSGFELLGGILNILQILDVIRRHVQDFREIDEILRTTELKVKSIETNVRSFLPLHGLDGVQSQILQNTVDDFEGIRVQLENIQDKVSNRSASVTFLSSPKIAGKLSEIDQRLTTKDDVLKLVGMICMLNMEMRSTCAHIVSLLTELNNNTPNIPLVESKIQEMYQMKMVEDSVRELTVRRKGYRIDQMTGYVHLSAGENLYNRKHGMKDYKAAAQHFHAAAKLGWSQAYYYLGMLCKNGWGVERCDVLCKTYFQLGADAGHSAAISQLAICYDEGVGAKRCSTLSGMLLKQGAEAGDPVGMDFYAWSKLNGYNTDVNFTLAHKFAAKAAEKGYGKNTLAQCYEQGIQVERDPLEAVRLHSEALHEGTSWITRLALAKLYERGNGIDIDLEKAAELYAEGCHLLGWQRPYFQGYYGMCLIRGRGVEEDKRRGWAEVEKSIRGNNATGWYVKGECFRHGYGIGQNFYRAAACYKRAVQMKNGNDGKISAKFALGSMYELGQGGLAVNYETAFEHYNYAAKRMHQEAQWKLALFCEAGLGVEQFYDRAAYFFKLAANSGHKASQLKTCEYYMKGKGVSRDLFGAIQILEPAAKNGDKKAKQLLRRARIQVLLRRGSRRSTRSLPFLSHETIQ